MKQQLLLHAGLHKTGTSAIQYYAARNRRRLLEGGILYPGMWPASLRPAHGHHLLAHALSGKGLGMSVRASEVEYMVRRWYRQAISADCPVLISSEAICRYMPGESEQPGAGDFSFVTRLKSVLSDFDVVPVLVVRRQDDFVRSLYQEHVSAGVGDSARISFPEFLDQTAVCKTRFLDRLRVFREHFGNVRLLVYEELAGAALPVVFLRQLGAEGLDDCEKVVVRRSLSVGETPVKQRLNKWISGRFQNRLVLMWLRSRPVQRIITRELGSIGTLWPKYEIRRQFVQQFDAENATIAAEFLGRNGVLFPTLEESAGRELSLPEAGVLDAVTSQVVRAARWRLQLILGRKAVSELMRG